MEYILEGIDAEMGTQQPKVILFDIGGVVVSDGRWNLKASPTSSSASRYVLSMRLSIRLDGTLPLRSISPGTAALCS